MKTMNLENAKETVRWWLDQFCKELKNVKFPSFVRYDLERTKHILHGSYLSLGDYLSSDDFDSLQAYADDLIRLADEYASDRLEQLENATL